MRRAVVSCVTYVGGAAQRDDEQSQWPEAARRGRGGEALGPAATASGSPHPRPCRARRAGVQGLLLLLLLSPSSSFSLLLPPPPPPRPPRSCLRALLLGCAGALKHCCSSHEGPQSRGEQVTFTFCVRKHPHFSSLWLRASPSSSTRFST